MIAYVLVAVGGALGSVLRFALNQFITRAAGESFPWGTILVNVIGSFVIGMLAALVAPAERMSDASRGFTTHFLIIGICGGFTTFSSFSLQTFKLLEAHRWFAAGGNILLSTVLCLLAVAAGYWLGQAFASTPTR